MFPPPSPRSTATVTPALVEKSSVHALARLVRAVVLMFGAACVIAGMGLLHQRSVLHDHLAGSASRAAVQSADRVANVSGVVAAILGIACLVVLGLWSRACVLRKSELGRSGGRFLPRGALLAWIVPGWNLVAPLFVLQELYRSSTPRVPLGGTWRHTKRSSMIDTLWVALVASIALSVVVGLISEGSSPLTPSDFDLRNTLALIVQGLRVVLVVLLVLVVRVISRRQAALAAPETPLALARG